MVPKKILPLNDYGPVTDLVTDPVTMLSQSSHGAYRASLLSLGGKTATPHPLPFCSFLTLASMLAWRMLRKARPQARLARAASLSVLPSLLRWKAKGLPSTLACHSTTAEVLSSLSSRLD